MKIHKKVYWFCVALLSSFMLASAEDLYQILEAGGIINDIFKPFENGSLGFGGFGVVYKGTLLRPIERKVAMKFTHNEDIIKAETEYEIYSYLHAIDNPEIELYGIPSVYYYGTWDTYTMMGMTLLDLEYDKAFRDDDLNELDLLILCKEFVRISKYIHSCGIVHNDMRADNMMFRRNNGFIIDFNLANKMYNTTTLDTSSRMAGTKYAKNDWKRFLQSACSQVDIIIDLNSQSNDPVSNGQIQNIMEKLETTQCEELRRVFVEMGKYIYGLNDKSKKNDKTSSYDQIYDIIEKEIASFGEGTPALVHWLNERDEYVAKQEFKTNPVKSISSITDPFKLARISYPEPDLNYFHKKMLKLTSERSSSSKNNKKNCSKTQSSGIDSIEKKRKI